MAMRKPGNPNKEIIGKPSSSSKRGTKSPRADDGQKAIVPTSKETTGPSDSRDPTPPVAFPQLTDVLSDDVEPDASDSAVEALPNEGVPPSPPDETPQEVLTLEDEPAEQQGPPLSVAELIELLASPRASAAIAELATLAVAEQPPMSVPHALPEPNTDSSAVPIDRPPLVPEPMQPSMELPSGDVGQQSSATSPSRTVQPPMPMLSHGASPNPPPDVQRLAIELEVSLSNMERVTEIATDKTKDEFKRLARQEVQEVRDDLWRFREQIRLAWGR